MDVKDDGSADLGPIAVCCQGKGVINHSSSSFEPQCHGYHHKMLSKIGSALLAWAEDNYPVNKNLNFFPKVKSKTKMLSFFHNRIFEAKLFSIWKVKVKNHFYFYLNKTI